MTTEELKKKIEGLFFPDYSLANEFPEILNAIVDMASAGVETIEVSGMLGNLEFTQEEQDYLISKMANNTLSGTIIKVQNQYYCQIIAFQYTSDTAGFTYGHFSGGEGGIYYHLCYD